MEVFLMNPYVEITTACNLRCLHCYNGSGTDSALITMNDLKQICDSMKKADLDHITFSGGEPTLHPNFKEFISFCCDEGFSITIVSNATMIEEELGTFLRDKNINFQISLNGVSPNTHDKLCGKGTFKRTMRGMDILLKYLPNEAISIHCMMERYNINELVELIKLAYNKKISSVSFAWVNSLGRAVDNSIDFSMPIEELIEVGADLKNNPIVKDYIKKGMNIQIPEYSDSCPFLGEDRIGIAPRIDSYGNVYLCQSFNDYSFGNIREINLYDLICASNAPVKLIEKIQEARKKIEKCKQCVWQYQCNGGCPAEAVMRTGDIGGEDCYCWYRSMDYLSQLKRGNAV